MPNRLFIITGRKLPVMMKQRKAVRVYVESALGNAEKKGYPSWTPFVMALRVSLTDTDIHRKPRA
ncbi:hypothetical protein EGK65_05550 [Citrobacter farmeri]|nr:hypothetical protein EGK65_05550 [Citrobacter farmeri]